MTTIEKYFPNWRDLKIHESSPSARGASARLASQCEDYLATHYFPEAELGSIVNGFRNESLESLTFPDSSIDLHITQDVMEHVFDPPAVFRELARTLRPGGAHVFTVPLVNKERSSERRAAVRSNGEIEYLKEASYHGNPISNEGSLVTVDWGFDICQHIFCASGLYTAIIEIDDLSKGIRAELIEVLITYKFKDDQSAFMI